MSIKEYYYLTKPGLTRGNLIMAGAAYLFGSGERVLWEPFFFMLFGLGCVVSSACAFNNYFDRELDTHMERTKNRALPAGRLGGKEVLLFASVLLFFGVAALACTNTWALLAALLGFVVYVGLYTPLKPHHPSALFVGAVAGAMPPVAGYAAANGTLDLWALFLFVVLFVWQVPHFLCIAAYRFEEYRAAGVPLFIKNPPSAAIKRRARLGFYASLVALLLFCAGLILQRWAR